MISWMTCCGELKLQRDNPEVLESDVERDQLQQQADSFVHAMENLISILRRIGLNTVPNVHTCSTSTLVSQLCQPAALPCDKYN